MPIKQGDSNKIILGLVTDIGLSLTKNDYKKGEKTPKGQMVPFSRGHLYRAGVWAGGSGGVPREILCENSANQNLI